MTNPFATAPAPTPETVNAPAPVTIPSTQNPAVVDPGAAAQAAAFAAWQAQQAAQAAAAAPPVDPQYAAFLAAQAAQQAVPAAPVAPAVPAGGDVFDDPAPQRPRGPRPQELYGRLVLIIPKLVERVPSNDEKAPAGTMVDRMTADVIVLDGGPLHYGGKPEKLPPIPHDKVAQIPFRQPSMYVSAVGIVSQCRDALAKRERGEPGMVVGRWMTGVQTDPKKQAPYLLEKATDADKALARAYLQTVDPFA